MIIPQHGWMYVKLLGWYQKLQSDSLELIDKLPDPMDMIRVEVLAVDPEPSEDDAHKYHTGMVVMARYALFAQLDVETSKVEPKTTTATGMIRGIDVMAIVEDDDGEVH